MAVSPFDFSVEPVPVSVYVGSLKNLKDLKGLTLAPQADASAAWVQLADTALNCTDFEATGFAKIKSRTFSYYSLIDSSPGAIVPCR